MSLEVGTESKTHEFSPPTSLPYIYYIRYHSRFGRTEDFLLLEKMPNQEKRQAPCNRFNDCKSVPFGFSLKNEEPSTRITKNGTIASMAWHISPSVISEMSTRNIARGLDEVKNPENSQCSHCLTGKGHRSPIPKDQQVARLSFSNWYTPT